MFAPVIMLKFRFPCEISISRWVLSGCALKVSEAEYISLGRSGAFTPSASGKFV